MSARHRLDDRTVDALLSGRLPAGSEEHADVVDLVMRLRASAEQAPPPRPSPALAALLAGGLPPPADKAPEPAVGEAARREAGVPSRPATRVRPLRRVAAKVAGLTLVAKLALATAAVAVTTAGVGFTGALPSPAAQEAFDRAFRHGIVAVEVPEGTDGLPADADPLPQQRDPARPQTGDHAERDPAPVPDAPPSRSDGPTEPVQDLPPSVTRRPADTGSPVDTPSVPEPGQDDEQPGPPREPEPGRGAGPVRPEEPSAPDEDGGADPAASAPEVDAAREDGVALAAEPVVPGQDRLILRSDPDGPPGR